MPSFYSIVCRVALLGYLCGSAPAWAQSTKAGGPRSFVSIEGSQIYFEECGTSPQTVVLLHDGARRVVLQDVGHLMYLEKPAEFSRLVVAFIEKNQSGEYRP